MSLFEVGKKKIMNPYRQIGWGNVEKCDILKINFQLWHFGNKFSQLWV